MSHENTKHETTKREITKKKTSGLFRVLAFRAFVWLVASLFGSPIHAHEIGTTRVSVFLAKDRSYQIDVLTDAASLTEKLAVMAGQDVPGEIDPAGLQHRLEGYDQEFRQRVKIRFDSIATRPAITYGGGTIRLSGRIPDGARQFVWSFGWTFASYAMTVRSEASGAAATEWLEGGQSSTPFALAAPPPPTDRVGTAWRYLTLGFTHIVPGGLDHVLFVVGIYLLSSRARSVLSQVTAFTIAHSITLGLSIYGIVAVSPRVVEPLIALSIAYVAIENVFLTELRSWRVAVVFAFGLLHGLGFAGALRELGLPRAEFATALLTFNAGVEAAQLAVIGTAFLAIGWHCANRPWYRSRIVVPASLLIACTSLYWTVERLAS